MSFLSYIALFIFLLLYLILLTLGTASNNPEKLEAMIEGGMNIACLNFEHGSLNYYEEVIENIKLASCNYNKKIGMTCPLAVAVVTKGPIIRTGFPIGVSNCFYFFRYKMLSFLSIFNVM